MVVADTSALIGSICGPRPALGELQRLLRAGERIRIPTLVLYEWLRGPRTERERQIQEDLFPARSSLPFGMEEAILAASLYAQMRRPRARAFDIAIAACALRHEAAVWTLNPRDFADIAGLRLVAGP